MFSESSPSWRIYTGQGSSEGTFCLPFEVCIENVDLSWQWCHCHLSYSVSLCKTWWHANPAAGSEQLCLQFSPKVSLSAYDGLHEVVPGLVHWIAWLECCRSGPMQIPDLLVHCQVIEWCPVYQVQTVRKSLPWPVLYNFHWNCAHQSLLIPLCRLNEYSRLAWFSMLEIRWYACPMMK